MSNLDAHDGRESAGRNELVAKALSHPTRVRILMAMNTPRRRLSPRAFAREEDVSVNHAAYHFRKLRAAGCIALVDTRKGRAGTTEHIYEPLERVLAWAEEWTDLSPDVKKVILTSVMGGAVKALGAAIDRGAFKDRDEAYLAWDTVALDEQGWAELNDILGLAVRELLHLEQECRTRIHEGADFLLASYCLASFESPRKPAPFDTRESRAKRVKRKMTPAREKRRALMQRLNERERVARAMRHPTRVRILMAMNTPRRRLSPKLFSKESGLPPQHCAYHFRELEDYGCVSLVDLVPRRGATETIYEARKQALQWTDDWTLLGPAVRQNVVVAIMRGAVEALGSAIEAGTFEARDDSHLAWSTIRVDVEGWSRMDVILDTALNGLMDIGRRVKGRTPSGDRHFAGSYFVASFESPAQGT